MPKAQRGEVWQIDFGLVAKVRPALIYSLPFTEGERALYPVVPHTTALRATRFEVVLPMRGLEKGAFDVQNLGAISEARLIRRLGHLSSEQLRRVDEIMKLWLGWMD
jgi:mRNA interferase MazF